MTLRRCIRFVDSLSNILSAPTATKFNNKWAGAVLYGVDFTPYGDCEPVKFLCDIPTPA